MPSGCPRQKFCVNSSWIRYSGLSSSILISSRTTCFSLAISVVVKSRAQDEIGKHIHRDGKMLVEHFGVEAGHFLGRERVEHAADGVHRLRDFFGRALARALEHHVLDEMRDAVALRRFGARSRAEPNAHGNRAHVRHLLRDDHHAVRQFRSLDIACWLIHCVYCGIRAAVNANSMAGCVSIHRVRTHALSGKWNTHSQSAANLCGECLTALAAPGVFGRQGSQSSGGNPIPQKRGEGCAKRSPTSVFPLHNVSRGRRRCRHFFIRLQVRQEKRLFFDDRRASLHEAAIGVDLHGLGDFLEGRAGFIISVNEHRNRDVNPRGSLPCNFGFCHGVTQRSAGFTAHLSPRRGMCTHRPKS